MTAGKRIAEFVGTFFLVLTIGLMVSTPGVGIAAPIAIAAVLIAMIYAGGHVSGAHYNPAVTLAILLRGAIDRRGAVGYVVTQFIAAAAAGGMIRLTIDGPIDLQITPKLWAAILFEGLFTFALCYVVLNVATAKANAEKPFFGIAIGLTVLAGALAVGGLTGGAFNPAVVLGMIVMGMLKPLEVWPHLIGQIVGAATAALVFRAMVRETP